MPYAALRLSNKSRAQVLRILPPMHDVVMGERIVTFFPTNIMPDAPEFVSVVGSAHDDNFAILAIKVKSFGKGPSRFRKDGKMYHLIVSRRKDAKPKDASDWLKAAKKTWFIKEPIYLHVEPEVVA